MRRTNPGPRSSRPADQTLSSPVSSAGSVALPPRLDRRTTARSAYCVSATRCRADARAFLTSVDDASRARPPTAITGLSAARVRDTASRTPAAARRAAPLTTRPAARNGLPATLLARPTGYGNVKLCAAAECPPQRIGQGRHRTLSDLGFVCKAGSAEVGQGTRHFVLQFLGRTEGLSEPAGRPTLHLLHERMLVLISRVDRFDEHQGRLLRLRCLAPLLVRGRQAAVLDCPVVGAITSATTSAARTASRQACLGVSGRAPKSSARSTSQRRTVAA